jgi:DNA mismatch repair protein MLH3
MGFLFLADARKKADTVCKQHTSPFVAVIRGLCISPGTSKPYAPGALNSLSTFGFRGEGQSSILGLHQTVVLMSMTALASAAELGCLEISSRTAKSRETWSIIVKGGSCLYSGPAVRWRRESSGTVVCVRDAFYNVSAFVKVFWTPHH